MKYCHLPMVLSIGLLLGACQSAPTAPAQPPTQDRTFALLDNIHHHILDNKMNVIIKEDKRAPVVMTQIWYKVGANDEPVGKGGISHFLEHLMFKDTPKVSGDEFSRLISHYGGTNNAYTNREVTVYHNLLPANRYALALELEANRMQNIVFKPEQIASERQVVLEERRVRTDDNPNAKAYEQFFAFVYGNTPRSRPIIGSTADINNITIDDLKQWYQTWYSPQNATLVLVGDVDKDEALTHIKQYFGKLPNNAQPERPPALAFVHPDDLSLPKNTTPHRHTTIKAAVQVPSLILAWQVPTISSLKITNRFDDKNLRQLMALGLLDDVLSGGRSSRFMSRLVQKELVNSLNSHYSTTGYGDTLFIINATPKQGVSLDATKQLILDELARTLDGDISPDELKRSQVALKSSLIFGAESVSGQAQLLGSVHNQGLPFEHLKQEFELLKSISSDEIKQTGKTYLTPQRMYSAYIISDTSPPSTNTPTP